MEKHSRQPAYKVGPWRWIGRIQKARDRERARERDSHAQISPA